jgi:hypothetical protein
MVSIQSVLPGRDRLQAVGDARKRRRNILVFIICRQFRTCLGQRAAYFSRFCQPLVDIVRLGPIGRPDDPLRRRLVQVRFVAELPVGELCIPQSAARQRHRVQKTLLTDGAVFTEIVAMDEFRLGPGGVGLEKGRSDIQDVRVVDRPARNDGPVGGRLQTGIVQRVISSPSLECVFVLQTRGIIPTVCFRQPEYMV